MSDDQNELDPSELGTKEYWTSLYSRDLKNFKNHGDMGDIWFGEDSGLRVLRWILKTTPAPTTKIVDLGCGNGMMLIELFREGFTDLTGIDYCQEAVDLAKSVMKSNSVEGLLFKVLDLTREVKELESSFDVALDKGTYDAISLNPDSAVDKRLHYIQNVDHFLKDEGYFIITSCNWTEEEIIKHFENYFVLQEILPTPKFNFGGKQGSLVSALVLKKKILKDN